MILLALHISGEDRVQPDLRRSPAWSHRPTILLGPGKMGLEKHIFRGSDPQGNIAYAPHIPLKT